MTRGRVPAVVAIPAKNEEERLCACLQALTSQKDAAADILVLLNNCDDGSLDICRHFEARAPGIHIVECTLPAGLASAGEARRLALEAAARLAPDGVLLTTDADSVVPPAWIASNLLALAQGADVVCGTAQVDPVEALLVTPEMHQDYMDECACFDLNDEIESIINSDSFDPWPRHQQSTGASIALRTPVFLRAGGAPPVASGEDRVLVERLRLIDAKIRHAPGINVIVSGRLEGRAAGGMAETMKRRMRERDRFTDERLEPAVDAYRRSLAKAASRAAWESCGDPGALAHDLLVAPSAMAVALSVPFFGAAWAEIQRLSPVLMRRRVSYEDLPRETVQARRLRDQILMEAITSNEAV